MLAFLVMKTKKNIQSMFQKILSKGMLNFYWWEKKAKENMLLSKILRHLCIIIHYIVGENASVVIVYKLLVQKKIVKDCFKINVKPMIKIPEKGEYVRFKNYEGKIELPFIIYADFESILLPEDNWKLNPDDSHTNQYQKHVARSYGYKLVRVDDKLSEPFKSYFGEDPVYNFTKSMIKKLNIIIMW